MDLMVAVSCGLTAADLLELHHSGHWQHFIHTTHYVSNVTSPLDYISVNSLTDECHMQGKEKL